MGKIIQSRLCTHCGIFFHFTKAPWTSNTICSIQQKKKTDLFCLVMINRDYLTAIQWFTRLKILIFDSPNSHHYCIYTKWWILCWIISLFLHQSIEFSEQLKSNIKPSSVFFILIQSHKAMEKQQVTVGQWTWPHINDIRHMYRLNTEASSCVHIHEFHACCHAQRSIRDVERPSHCVCLQVLDATQC